MVSDSDVTSDGDLVLEATGLRRSFGDLVAVNGVDVRIAARETYGLLGPNGAGKTTTISMIAGLLQPDAGEVTVAGQRLTTRSVRAKAAIGLVPQELAVYPDLTGRENLRFFGKLYGLAGQALAARVDEVLEVIGLADRAGDPTKEYSGGMQRRLNIGIGLLHRPRLLILDEPTVGVDPQSRNAILESVELLAREGMAVLYTTHYMEEAERLCRRELVALVGERDRVSLAANGTLEAAAQAAAQIDGVASASATSAGIEVVATDASPLLPRVLTRVADAGAQVTGVEVVQPDLETVFLHLTGKALRD
jgi:ABC-2 type transport system ATP-binding protein